MRIKNVVYLFGLLLLLSGFMYRTEASSINSVSFHGVGVTIDLAFPEEAHPAESITHNVTITANTALTLNFTIIIYAPVNSVWQDVKNQNITNFDLQENGSLPIQMRFTLPQQANGTLKCFLYVQTDQSTDYSSYTFYTTQVRTLTYSELLSQYNDLLANYSRLQTDYNTSLSNYNELSANYISLNASYETLLDSYNNLLVKYDALNVTYNQLLFEYGTLNSTYNSLSVKYDTLNSTYNSLLSRNSALQSDYNLLNSTYYTLQTNYDSLQTNYNSLQGRNNALQSIYNSLNSTHYSLQASYNSLEGDYGFLNQSYASLETEFNDLQQSISFSENALNTDRILMFIFTMTVAALIALIIYIKRKKPEPYVVVRKETVSLKPDETS